MEGKQILYRGREVRIHLHIDKKRRRMRPELEGDCIILHTPTTDSQELGVALERWLIQQARMIIPVRVMYFQQVTEGKVNDIRIKDQKTRWGSCSSKRNLNFNWRLVMAPPEVLDYVVVHELCHLTHMNHSRDFWNMVGTVMPEYKERKKWLRENQERLMDDV